MPLLRGHFRCRHDTALRCDHRGKGTGGLRSSRAPTVSKSALTAPWMPDGAERRRPLTSGESAVASSRRHGGCPSLPTAARVRQSRLDAYEREAAQGRQFAEGFESRALGFESRTLGTTLASRTCVWFAHVARQDLLNTRTCRRRRARLLRHRAFTSQFLEMCRLEDLFRFL